VLQRSMAKSPVARYLRTDNAPQASQIFVGILFSEQNKKFDVEEKMKISSLFDYQGRYAQEQLWRWSIFVHQDAPQDAFHNSSFLLSVRLFLFIEVLSDLRYKIDIFLSKVFIWCWKLLFIKRFGWSGSCMLVGGLGNLFSGTNGFRQKHSQESFYTRQTVFDVDICKRVFSWDERLSLIFFSFGFLDFFFGFWTFWIFLSFFNFSFFNFFSAVDDCFILSCQLDHSILF